MFELKAPFAPCGDQPQAIDTLINSAHGGKKSQVLLGITGSGKTFTMANVIEKLQKPTLIIAHNKTLAAQLYQEFKGFFPNNAVEYFVSYYDYYQPEAYIARTDTYIEKDFAINDKIERMRLSATKSLLERRDVIIVASVSCIYGLGSPEFYKEMVLYLKTGDSRHRDDILIHLVQMQYERSDELMRATFRSRGDVLDIFPAYEEDIAVRIEFFGDEVERISWFDPLTGQRKKIVDDVSIYPGSHYVTPAEVRERALETIKRELQERLNVLEALDKPLEMQRLQQRTLYDIEMIREVGFCNGIENYSRHFSGRLPGEPPQCLIDYFPDDWLLIIDESHQTIPQLHAMYNGDRARKTSLIEYGFRLPSAYDNRPLRFEETYSLINQVLYVSATPGAFEISEADGIVVEQIIRPTGLLDPQIEIKPAATQVDDALAAIHEETKNGGRVLVTTLTKRLAEELTKYLCEIGVKAKYLHSEIDVLERFTIIHELRAGKFDVLVGINLLREGLDIPEVSLVVILDADKEGFLRSETSLIQICGRAARNVNGHVIMYADTITAAIRNTVAITERRRAMQQAYNLEHNITPQSTKRGLALLEVIEETERQEEEQYHTERKEQIPEEMSMLSREEIAKHIQFWKRVMEKAAKELRFDDAAHARDMVRKYQDLEVI